jgi:peptide/nickel transport system ATP-binding protein
MNADHSATLLRIRGLHVAFRRRHAGDLGVLQDVDLDVNAGEIVGVVGESASGKSTLAASLLRLHDPRDAVVHAKEMRWRGRDLEALDERALRRLRGAEMVMVFQDPMTALDPLIPVVGQVAEVIRAHRALRRAEARREAIDWLARVGLDEATARRRPFELSGGQRQRALIAMAIVNRPRLIVADEPTTALDATVQAEVLALLRALSREVGAAMLLISHDLGVIARMADRVLVMYGGQIVETAGTADLLRHARMPYTWGLLESAPGEAGGPRVASRPIPGAPPDPAASPPGCRFHPRCEYAQELCRSAVPPLREVAAAHFARCHFADRSDWRPRGRARVLLGDRSGGDAVLELRGIRKVFRAGARAVTAIEHVDLELARGEILALVGESGSGKSTLARIVVRLLPPSAGVIRLDGQAIDMRGVSDLRAYRRRVQMVFQDPASSLNPRMRIIDAVAEPRLMMGEARAAARERASILLERCGLAAALHARYPHELSGGQRQRVGIARALVPAPEVVVLDEPVSSLDVSIRAQIIDLLREMRDATGASFVFISHDLAVVRELSDRTAVMRHGRIVELARTETLFRAPCEPYTRALLAAIPAIPTERHAR